jgi:hypothetical protein
MYTGLAELQRGARRILGLLAAGLLGLAHAAIAQGHPVPVSLDSGTLIRVQVPGQEVIGRLVVAHRLPDTTFRFCRYPGPPCTDPGDSVAIRSLPLHAIHALDVQSGTQWKRGAAIGGFIGGVLGGLAAAYAVEMCEGSCPSGSSATVIGVFGGGLMFGGFGALWGSAFPRWKHVFD